MGNERNVITTGNNITLTIAASSTKITSKMMFLYKFHDFINETNSMTGTDKPGGLGST